MILTGLARLGRDAELRYTGSGDPVASLSLAYDYSGGKSTQWVDASMFGMRASALVQYLKKGVAVAVVITDLHIATWAKKDGTNGVKLVGKVLELEFAGGQRQEQASGGFEPLTKPRPPSDDLEDDIPF